MKSYNIVYYAMGVSMGFVIGMTVGNPHLKKIPYVEKVQEGYVNLSKLEIVLEDVDKNGASEVVMKYKGSEYAFKEDAMDKPYIMEYKRQRIIDGKRNGK